MPTRSRRSAAPASSFSRVSQAAAARAGRDPGRVTLVAVSKTVPAGRIRAAVEAGLRVLGENRVQEGAAKIPEVAGAAWHLIGPLQSNKARRAVELFDVIETVHAVELAHRLDRLAAELRPGRPLPVLLQVNVDRDPAKAGLDPDALEDAIDALDGLEALEFRGLMTIGRFGASPEESRATFASLRELSARRAPSGHAWGRSCPWACPTTTASPWRRAPRSSASAGRSSVTGRRPRGSMPDGPSRTPLLDSGRGLRAGLPRRHPVHAVVARLRPRADQLVRPDRQQQRRRGSCSRPPSRCWRPSGACCRRPGCSTSPGCSCCSSWAPCGARSSERSRGTLHRPPDAARAAPTASTA